MRLWEILSEAVGGNYLYHSVEDIDTALAILNDGVIEPSLSDDEYIDPKTGKSIDTISVSRNPATRYPYGRGNVQFVIDKGLLRKHNFIVKPYSMNASHKASAQNSNWSKAEAEERIINPVPMKYVKEIQVSDYLKGTPTFRKLQKYCKSYGISISLMKTPASGKFVKSPSENQEDAKVPVMVDGIRFELDFDEYTFIADRIDKLKKAGKPINADVIKKLQKEYKR